MIVSYLIYTGSILGLLSLVFENEAGSPNKCECLVCQMDWNNVNVWLAQWFGTTFDSEQLSALEQRFDLEQRLSNVFGRCLFGLLALVFGLRSSPFVFGLRLYCMLRQRGATCLGTYRVAEDDPEVIPRRVTKIMKEVRDGFRTDKTLDRSDEHVREGQGADRHKMEQDRLSGVGVDGELAESDEISDDDFASLKIYRVQKATTPSAVAEIQPNTRTTDAPTPKGTVCRTKDANSVKEKPVRERRNARAKQKEAKPARQKPAPKPKADSKLSPNPAAKKRGAAKNEPKSKLKQNVDRELRAAEQIASKVELNVSHFSSDADAVTLGETIANKKKLAPRLELESDQRWIYACGDILPEDERADEIIDARSALLERVRTCNTQNDAMMFVLRSLSAAPSRDPENCTADKLKQGMLECIMAEVKLAPSVFTVYFSRLGDEILLAAQQQYEKAWTEVISLKGTQIDSGFGDNSMIDLRMIFLADPFSEILSILNCKPVEPYNTEHADAQEVAPSQGSSLDMTTGSGIHAMLAFMKSPELSSVQRAAFTHYAETLLNTWHPFTRPAVVKQKKIAVDEHGAVEEVEEEEEEDGEQDVEMEETQGNDSGWETLIVACDIEVLRAFFSNAADVEWEDNNAIKACVDAFVTLINAKSRQLEEIAAALQAVRKQTVLKCSGYLGESIQRSAEETLHPSFQRNTFIRRISKLETMANAKSMTTLPNKMKASACVGKRFCESLAPLKECLLEYRKISAAIEFASTQIEGSSSFVEMTTKLQKHVQDAWQLETIKFHAGISVALGKANDLEKCTCIDSEMVMFMSPKLLFVFRSVSEMCWTGLGMTTEWEKDRNQTNTIRADIVSNIVHALEACIAVSSVDDNKSKSSVEAWEAAHAQVHRATRFLQNLNIHDGVSFVDPENSSWKSSACRSVLLEFRCLVHKHLLGVYTSDIQRWYPEKRDRLTAKILDVACGQNEAEEASSNLLSGVIVQFSRLYTAKPVVPIRNYSETWRLAAASVLLSSSDFCNPARDAQMELHNSTDKEQDVVDVNSGACIALHDFENVVYCVSKLTQAGVKLTALARDYSKDKTHKPSKLINDLLNLGETLLDCRLR